MNGDPEKADLPKVHRGVQSHQQPQKVCCPFKKLLAFPQVLNSTVAIPTQLTLSSTRSVSEHSHPSTQEGEGNKRGNRGWEREETKQERTFLPPVKTACSNRRSHFTVLIQSVYFRAGRSENTAEETLSSALLLRSSSSADPFSENMLSNKICDPL